VKRGWGERRAAVFSVDFWRGCGRMRRGGG